MFSIQKEDKVSSLTDKDEFLRALACSPPMVFHAGDHAVIRVADGGGHLLDGATITGWLS